MSVISAIHAGLTQLGIEGEDQRDFYERVTGERGLTKMTPRQHLAVLQELRRMGFKPVAKGGRKPNGAPRKQLEGKYARKLQALWIAGYNLGVIHDRTDEALISFVKGRVGVDHVRFLHDATDANIAIEALKAWLARDGGVNWKVSNGLSDWMRADGAKIAMAQWSILLKAGGVDTSFAAFDAFCVEACRQHVAQMGRDDWQPVMNRLGPLVRKAKTRQARKPQLRIVA